MQSAMLYTPRIAKKKGLQSECNFGAFGIIKNMTTALPKVCANKPNILL